VITLVLGGAGSGKSALAERLAERLAARSGLAVTYLATGASTDDEMATRIAAHQARRPGAWRTVEAGAGLVDHLAGVQGPALIDSLGTWVAGAPGFAVDCDRLCRVLEGRSGDTVVVSEEVGLGVHPSSASGRHFRDALGVLNQAVARIADDVLLVVAGRALHLERP
jgi:adenosylcobinamide kinase / adenosylcobinamide-phosphate guanylyltransferase